MNAVRVGVVGATGYSGAVATRLLATHPKVELVFCTSDLRAGQPVGRALGAQARAELAFVPNGEAVARSADVDVVFLATSAEVSAKLAPAILGGGRHVIDLSGAFRLASEADFATWYGLAHPAPALISRAHYGLPELFGGPLRRQGEASLVSNPGCYPTAALLALAPLLREGLIEPRGIIVDAKSGVTGAGRQSKEEYSFAEVDEDLRAYKLLSHQHTPEIARYLGAAAAQPAGAVSLTFTPHLLPVKRGLLATCYARPRPGADAAKVAECLKDAYAASRFVEAVTPAQVTLTSVVGTNGARVGATADGDVVVAIGAIDNLLKGASGQAVQNLNLLFGFDEGAGLAHLQRSAP